ncbi:MAG TPA: response regulator [Anaerolineales bacterium]|nr:response regulator [Anaerolineales bacterium]HRF49533.1 response regulator [Anaerolineales bacterium]
MSHTILVADDETDTLDLLEITLGRAGYRVLRALNGREALDLARSERPDLVILDIMMPQLSGLDVLAALRADGAPTPVIVFSARGRADDLAAGIEAGAVQYLVKPTSRDRLLEAVRVALAETAPADDAVNTAPKP